MRTIQIITTGGTIGMAVDPESQGAKPNSFSFITDNISLFSPYARIQVDSYLNIPSPHITLDHMVNLAQKVTHYLKQPEIDGVVITHGTDTMEETAYYLQHVLPKEKPVIITGSMSNQSEASFDGLQNLVHSVHIATLPESAPHGVLVVFQNEVHSPIYMTKTYPDRLPFFESLVVGPMAKRLKADEFEWIVPALNHPQFPIQHLTKEVVLFTAYAGMDRSYIDWAIANKKDGIVIQALGFGHLPPAVIPAIVEAIQSGIPVVITSRCAYSATGTTYAYEGGGKHLEELGCILAQGNGQKIRIFLSMILEQTTNATKIKTYFS
ncbi:L-asparaginase [Thermoactinomyces sp. DSM 45891]|uniref:asparaginase n=1 Tax=Thermoactinomyces sp. DSM 45891 TaxID=1761907 RepID=UPI00091D69F3|nr:asparaginase [Thermoactinomyces sp. DSM 45891]SFX01799.1 L-asparaginase [Thermoactinomyces sp. DSM 45891]